MLKRCLCQIIYVISICYVLFLLASCENKNPVRKLSPEDTALLILEYSLTLNQSGLEQFLCKKCSFNPYKTISYEKRLLTEAFEKSSVAFNDRNAHDLRNIKCSITSKDESNIYLNCKGKYILLKNDKTFADASYIDKEIVLHIEENRLTDCPPVCSSTSN